MTELTLERLFDDPDINGSPPGNLQFSPCGNFVTYLKNNASNFEQLDLWRFDIQTGQSRCLVDASGFEFANRALSDEEKANRERKRIGNTGIVEYFPSPDGNSAVFPLDGILMHHNFASDETSKLSDEHTFETDISFSPDGKKLSFVRDKNIFLINLSQPQTQIQLTHDGGDTVSNGIAEFIAQEEMHRYEGYWWSPDSSKIAYIQADESSIMLSQRYEIDADRFEVFDQRYPFAGTNNANTRFGIIDIETRESRWIDLPRDQDDYLARVKWLTDSNQLAIQLQSRDQRKLDLIVHNLETGKNRCLLTETSDTWINLHDDLHFLKSGNGFIWSSERSGYKHLYLYDLKGGLMSQLTQGEWMVSSLVNVDEDRGEVYFDGHLFDEDRHSPVERHLYRLSINPINSPPAICPTIRKITRDPGWHQAILNKKCSYYLDRFSNHRQPPRVSIHRVPDSSADTSALDKCLYLDENKVDAGHPLFPYRQLLSQVDFGSIKAEDGQDLYYKIIKPANFDPEKKYPAIVLVYGGPCVQTVTDTWSPTWYHYMTQQGYVLFQLDNRGSSNRGKSFESPICGRLGDLEVKDQLKGVEYLSRLGFVDPGRIGVYGHSYGGYMTLMLLMKSRNIFAAGVSGAPVTDWLLYDTHYTERYLGHPQHNVQGYSDSNLLNQIPLNQVPGIPSKLLSAKLLVVHGMADDNVLFTHSTKLFKKLQDMNIPFEMMTYPGAKHGFTGRKVQIHFYGVMDRFFDRWLKPGN